MNRALLASLVALGAACSREAPPPPATSSNATATPAPASADDTLAGMDPRTPVPLLPMMADHQKQNMRDHLAAVQEIVAALATDDFAAIDKAAGRIGYSEPMGQMCQHMGAGATGFTDQALAFHHTADRIGAAARDHDRGRVLVELGVTLQACTSCHETWKQQVVDEPTWTRLTAMAPPTHAAPP